MLRFSSGSHNHYHYHNKLDSRSATPSETDASVALWLLVQSIPDAFQSLKNPDRPRITSTSAVTTTTSSTSTESTSNPFADLFAGRNTPRRACCRMSLNGFVLLLMEEILHHLIGSLSHLQWQAFIYLQWWRVSDINSITIYVWRNPALCFKYRNSPRIFAKYVSYGYYYNTLHWPAYMIYVSIQYTCIYVYIYIDIDIYIYTCTWASCRCFCWCVVCGFVFLGGGFFQA